MSVHSLAEGASAIVKQSKVQVANLESRNKKIKRAEKYIFDQLSLIHISSKRFAVCFILLWQVLKEMDLLFCSSTEDRLCKPETYLIVAAQNNMFACESN